MSELAQEDGINETLCQQGAWTELSRFARIIHAVKLQPTEDVCT